MAAMTTPICDFGWKAPGFSLPGIDGASHTLDGVQGANGTLVMFICNHCREELAQAGGVTGRGDRAGIADAVGMVLDDRRKTIIASPRAPKATLVARAATKPHKGACPPTPNHLIGTQT